MKRGLTILLIAVGNVLPAVPAYASTPSKADSIVIAELQTTGKSASGSAVTGEEFVELYNPLEQIIDITGWKVQYFSSSSGLDTPSKTIELGGYIASKGRYLIASQDYLEDQARMHFTAGFKDTGGHLRLASGGITTPLLIHDLVGWGTAEHPEGNAAAAPKAGESLKRIVDEDGYYRDTDNNSLDLLTSTEPSPEDTPVEAPPPPPDDDPVDTPDDPSESPGPEANEEVLPSAYMLPPVLTELMPDPKSPQTDSKDEFIELYNPNDADLPLKGYKLQTGNSFGHSFTFDTQTIPAKGFKAFYVTETGVLLSNTASQARIVDVSGVVSSVADAYEKAETGQAWALIDGAWQWTTLPTPDAANVLARPEPKPEKSASKKTSNKKTTKKVAGSSTKKSAADAERTEYEEAEGDGKIAPVHNSVLAGMGAVAIGYAGYEYRQDVANRLHQLRLYRSARRKDR